MLDRLSPSFNTSYDCRTDSTPHATSRLVYRPLTVVIKWSVYLHEIFSIVKYHPFNKRIHAWWGRRVEREFLHRFILCFFLILFYTCRCRLAFPLAFFQHRPLIYDDESTQNIHPGGLYPQSFCTMKWFLAGFIGFHRWKSFKTKKNDQVLFFNFNFLRATHVVRHTSRPIYRTGHFFFTVCLSQVWYYASAKLFLPLVVIVVWFKAPYGQDNRMVFVFWLVE